MRESIGCVACDNTGYHGRIALFELFPVNADAEKIIAANAGYADLYAFATARGMVTMQQDGMLKVLHGITTVAEIEAATGPIPL
jgi:type II secretory ATPase GspE/PulE/Tfp pilus assembly ATPase PilB-like protein